MEAGSEGEKKKPPEGEIKTKRKMKTASQLEILEKTYAAEAYPSEALRAELSVKLGLSDRQLQMWFCHRRLKERKQPGVKKQRNGSPAGGTISTPVSEDGKEMLVGGVGSELASGLGSGSSPFGKPESRQVVPRPVMGIPRSGFQLSPMKRYYDPAQSIAELRAIELVEVQLGEPLREDGPILGMEFDPLPPDAFGAPVEVTTVGQQRQSGRPFEAKIYERSDGMSNKGGSRTLHEYQFLPEQPTVRAETYERVGPTYNYGSPDNIPNPRTLSVSTGRSFLNGSEMVPPGYRFQDQIPGINSLSQQVRQAHLLPSASGEYESVPRKNSFMNCALDTDFGAHPITQMDNPFLSSERRVIHEEELTRLERKRKSEEARVQRELEAHEKRIRKEHEKQDILRRKREEQMRKEMERLDRERRKEEERLLRERQREEERYQREQRRELERREKFLQKESIRVEKMRQKEELRREKDAARIKAANERAIARRIAKESTELIEDERLELMELAASSKGFSSILSLDYDTLQNLELYRGMRKVFPTRSLHLKRPFSIQPWSDSDENVGNLLMVWRFLITFSDVLGMWPFTLDEFIQAFHDSEPRLLGEVHIAVLRCIIKDIEDVARTPSNGVGGNQNSAASPGGGHPQIVEGAYAWGFDIRNWQCHLNPSTWPEILRQFSLSAGFGPQLKKRNFEQTYPREDIEGNDGEHIISNLRNGAAVENAVAIMQERGFSNLRRSRHRLTPGTVKFAAFHVLSLEGSVGLNILEVADRIQKSGLRDLTTSKTPEASISAALSRDSKLFERTAPSTYCVRAAYRKDPTDAETILSAARERIRIFKSGFLDAEEPDDAERDEDSESDVAEDPEVDDIGTEMKPKKEFQNFQELNVKDIERNGKNGDVVLQTPHSGHKNVSEGLPSIQSEGFNEVNDIGSTIKPSTEISINSNNIAIIDNEDSDINESNLGETWVQGLTEGEYSDLSVEERLNALVSLIGVANEGNSIRIALEERLEAANALKKQMLAEAQLDKRRMKDEYVVKMPSSCYMGNKNEPNITIPMAEGKQGPLPIVDDNNEEALVAPAVQQDQLLDHQNDLNYGNSFPSQGNLQMPDYSASAENSPFQPPGYAAEKSRSRLKSYIGHLAEEVYAYKSLPLGLDRRRNRYWQFITSRNDPGCGRIFMELHDGHWRLIDSEEDFDALLASLDVRGIRESHLHTMLQRIEISFKESVRRNVLCSKMGRQSGNTVKREAVEKASRQDGNAGSDSPISTVCVTDSDISETSTSFAIQLGQNEPESNDALKRYQDFDKWLWKECLNLSRFCAMKYGKERCRQLLGICNYCHNVYICEDNHCPSCHRTYSSSKSSLNFSEHVDQCRGEMEMDAGGSFHGSLSTPLRMRLLKAQLSLIEVSIPSEALEPIWTETYRKSWAMKLYSASSAEDLLQVLTMLECATKRDYLSSNFETTSELLGSSTSIPYSASDSFCYEKIHVLPWVPHTTAAVTLRLMEFDSSVFYLLQQKLDAEKEKRTSDFTKLPSKYVSLENPQGDGATKALYQAEHPKENCIDVGTGLASSNHGRGHGRSRGGSSQRRAIGSRSEKRLTVTGREKLGQVDKWKGRPRGRGGRQRGRRSIRSRQKSATKVDEMIPKMDTPKNTVKLPRLLIRGKWNGGETTGLQVEDEENASSSEKSDYNDEIGQATAYEYDAMVNEDDYSVRFNKSNDIIDGSDYNVDDDEDNDTDDDEEEEEDAGEHEQGDLDIQGYINGESESADGQSMDADHGHVMASTSSDYSD